MPAGQSEDRCPACGAADAVAERCRSCGIALAPVGDVAQADAAAEHVALFLGDAPRIVPGAGPLDDAGLAQAPAGDPAHAATGRPSGSAASTSPRPRRLSAAAALVAAATLAILVSLFAARDRGSVEFRTFAAYLDAPALAPVDAEPALDADARLAEIERAHPGVAVPDVPSLSAVQNVHALGDAFVATLADVSPWWALSLGRHPHPAWFPGDDRPGSVATLRLMRDALRQADRLSADPRLTPHERLDLTVLRGFCEAGLRAGLGTDHDRLIALDWTLESLSWMRDVRCCDVARRAAAAAAIIESLPELLATQVGGLQSPALPEVMAVARHLDEDRAWLADYAASWEGISAADASRLTAGAVRAEKAVGEAVHALRTEVAPRAQGALGIGRERIASQLRAEHHLPFDVREVYERALVSFREADDAVRELSTLADDDRRPQFAADEAMIDDLWRSVERWVPWSPAEPELGIARPRTSMRHRAVAMYFDAGALADASEGVIVVGPIPATGDEEARDAERISRVHTFAHETYPGHRLGALTGRTACTIRRCFPDSCASEGWAIYAEDLLHETGGCTPGVLDDWVRARERLWLSQQVLVELLCATGAAQTADLRRLLEILEPGEEGLADLGAVTLRQGDHLHYLIGRDEILRLRASEERRLGAAFDQREFHLRLLAEGAVPARLVEEAWALELR